MYRSRVGLDAQKPGIAREMTKAKFRHCHEKKLQEIRSRAPGTGTLDNTPPYTSELVHLKTRPKKKATLAARDAEVERANRELLRQMARIFMTPSTLLPVADTHKGGNSLGERRMVCRSINALERRKELQRIAMENKHLVKHLGAVTSSYNVASWERENLESRKVMQRLRTVRYKRRRASAGEFCKRGVRYLRKQVERSRGQAFEAGFAPIPGLSETRRRRKRSREGKGHGQENAAHGGEREQRFGSEGPNDGGRRKSASSRVRLRAEGEAIDPIGNVAGSTAAATDVGVFSATEGERRNPSGEGSCSASAGFAENGNSSESTQSYRETAVDSNPPISGRITAGKERFKGVGAGDEDDERGGGSGMSGGFQVAVRREDVFVKVAGEGARGAKTVRQGEENDEDPYKTELEDDDQASGLLSGEECSEFGGEEGKGEECTRSGDYPSDFEEEKEEEEDEEERHSNDEHTPPKHKHNNGDEPTSSSARETAMTASDAGTLQEADMRNFERRYFNTTEGTIERFRGTLETMSGGLEGEDLEIPLELQEMSAKPGMFSLKGEESCCGKPIETTAHQPGEASLTADRLPTAAYPHVLADDRVSVERSDSAVSTTPVPEKPQETYLHTREQNGREFTDDVLKSEDRSDEYSEFSQESVASFVASDVGAHCVVGCSGRPGLSITGTSGAISQEYPREGRGDLRPKDKSENGSAGAAEDTQSGGNPAPPKETIQQNNSRDCLEETDRRERIEKQSAGNARGESDDYAQDTPLREDTAILIETIPPKFFEGDTREQNAQEKPDERTVENTEGQSEDHHIRTVPRGTIPQDYPRDNAEDCAQETYDGRLEEKAGEKSDEDRYQDIRENRDSIRQKMLLHKK